jgi:hypothetical protein
MGFNLLGDGLNDALDLTMRTSVGGPNVADLSPWAVCSPILRVSRESGYVLTELWDMRALVAVATSLAPGAVGSDGTPAIKF